MTKKLPKVKYKGELKFTESGSPISCAVLEDGTRVLSEYSIIKTLGTKSGTSSGSSKRAKKIAGEAGVSIPVFLAINQLKPFIPKGLEGGPLKPIMYNIDGKIETGYQAEILPILCDIWLKAREAGALIKSQLHKAQEAEILARSLAKVGIVALIDEATGYQFDRKHDALRILVQAYVEDELQQWVKTFPDSFFVALDNIYKNERTTSRSRPRYYGKFINKYIYKPIESGFVKDELDNKNITNEGKRKARFHQWLTDHGRNQLIMRIGKIEGLMEASSNKRRFEENVKRLTQPSLFDIFIDEKDEKDEN